MPNGFFFEDEAFKFYDLDGDERITAQELQRIHSAEAANGDILGEHNTQPYSLLSIKRAIAALDTDGSGDVSYAEFDKAAVVQQSQLGTTQDNNFTETIMQALMEWSGILPPANDLTLVQRFRLVRQNATARRKAKNSAAARRKEKKLERFFWSRRRAQPKVSPMRSVYGEVHELYTFGAPACSEAALENGKTGDRRFNGLRVVSHDREEGLLWGYWYKSDPISWATNVIGYKHPKIDVLVLRKFDTATPEHMSFAREDSLPEWPDADAPPFHIGLHGCEDYTALVEAQAHWPLPTQMFRYSKAVYAADQRELHDAALAYGSRLLEYYHDHDDVVALVQDESTLECTLVFTGSNDIADWLNNARFINGDFCGIIEVHSGFREELLKILNADYFKNNVRTKLPMCSRVRVTGHSLGGAIASLFAACVNRLEISESDPDHQLVRWTPASPKLMSPGPGVTVS